MSIWSVTRSCKVSEGLRPSQKDPLKNSNLEPICSGHKRRVPLKLVGVNEIAILDDLTSKFMLRNRTFAPQIHDAAKLSEIQRDPSLITRANRFKIRVFKWVLLRWSESLWKRVCVRDVDSRFCVPGSSSLDCNRCTQSVSTDLPSVRRVPGHWVCLFPRLATLEPPRMAFQVKVAQNIPRLLDGSQLD